MTNSIVAKNKDNTSVLNKQGYEKTLICLLESENLAHQIGNIRSLIPIYESFIHCYEELGEYDIAAKYYKKLLKTKDQYYNDEKNAAIAKLQIEYEIEQKEKELQAQLQRKQDTEKINLQLEEMVEKRTQLLSIQNKQLKQYAYIVAHDLKEPLCNLSGVADLLNENYRHQLEPIAQNFLQHITQSTTYMNRLLEDLLIYATLDKNTNDYSTACITEVMEEVKRELKKAITQSNAKIIMNNMPAALKITRKHLILLLQNLLSNSLQFHRKNVATLIRINLVNLPNYYKIEIKDNGIGIAPENQSKIFNIFHRLDKANYEGTGIGLAICEKVVQMYGGQIGVKSTLDKGSIFYFTIPR